MPSTDLKCTKEKLLWGIPVVQGIAKGVPYRFTKTPCQVNDYSLNDNQVAGERDRYYCALEQCKTKLLELKQHLNGEGADNASSVISTHALLTDDVLFQERVEEQIQREQCNVESILTRLIEEKKQELEPISNDVVRDALFSMEDLVMDLINILQGGQGQSLIAIPWGSILIAPSLFPSDLAKMQKKHVAGLVLGKCGQSSHIAIMARSRGIPSISGTVDGDDLLSSTCMILDGYSGRMVVNPSRETSDYYGDLQEKVHLQQQALCSLSLVPAKVKEGRQIALRANLSSSREVDELTHSGAKGIGLFRTELMALQQSAIPSREEQVNALKALSSVVQEIITVRLFDFGGDKTLRSRSGRPLLKEGRGIRLLLKHPDILREQITAIVQASVTGSFRLLIPMVSCLDELLAVKAIVKQVQQELGISADLPIGSMIELPAAVMEADQLALHSDFFSIGSNDLVHFTLGIDRESQEWRNLGCDI